jgi:hypothetical protein
MRLAAERRVLLQAKDGWSPGMHNFKTNHAREIKLLNDIKAKYKQLSITVVQDLYNVLNDVGMVEELLQMTFPMFLEKEAGYGHTAQMFSKPKNIAAIRYSRPIGAGAGDNFWTDTLVRSYLKMQGKRPD